VAIEDKRFYDHRGVDLRALLRAAYANWKAQDIVEGGSTITQQYVKNTVVGAERSLGRKTREALIAFKLERDLSKDEILTRYLNTIYFGHGAYGIQAAAQTYFSKSVEDITLPEAAMLAGLIASPGDYDPVNSQWKAKYRRNTVLVEMLEQGLITQDEFDVARVGKVHLDLPAATERYEAAYFVDAFKRWFLENPRFGDTYTQRYNLLFKGGLRIYATVDLDTQAAAEEAVASVLSQPGDPYGAMAVLDPRTGEVKAMVGGRDFFSTTDPVAQVNLATGDGGGGRPSGSAFKPFALVAALERGIPPQKLYPSPGAMTFVLPQGSNPPTWTPTNFGSTNYGTISLERATIDSVNVAYAQVVRDLGGGNLFRGAAEMVRTAREMGITSDLQAVPSAVLGINPVNPLEMASAYGTLADGGYHVPPVLVTRIVDPSGTAIFRARPEPVPAIQPPIAYVANQILQKVVLMGTGAAANFGRPAFGKTGTAQDHRDAWFVGSIPQLTAAVWVGYPRERVEMVAPRVRIPEVTGGSWPAQIWRVFMVKATEGMPVMRFPAPVSEYVELQVDITRGCLPNRYTPPWTIQTVRYLRGTEPTRTCTEPTGYEMLDVPSVVGLDEAAARSLLEDTGFDVAVVEEVSGQRPGTVIGQDPAGGEQAQMTSVVTITVAVGGGGGGNGAGSDLAVVPDVTGLTEDQAIATLQAAGFEVAVVVDGCDLGTAGCHPKEGRVWRQDPFPGDETLEGVTVTVWVNP
jgi:penicillin-binding protein 1A